MFGKEGGGELAQILQYNAYVPDALHILQYANKLIVCF